MKTLPADVFLAPHGFFFHLTEKRAAMKEDPAHNPFIVPGEFQAFLEQSQREFEAELKKQQQGK